MTETIALNIKPKDLKVILVDYYKKLYNDDTIKIIFDSDEKLVGYYEDKELITTVKMERKLNIGNQTGIITYELSKEDIKEVINYSINDENYEIVDITLKTEKEYYQRGYGDYPEFTELKATLKRKEKVKQKIKEK